MRKAIFRILEQCAISAGPREGILGCVTMTNITLCLKLFPLFDLSAELIQLVLRDEPFLFCLAFVPAVVETGVPIGQISNDAKWHNEFAFVKRKNYRHFKSFKSHQYLCFSSIDKSRHNTPAAGCCPPRNRFVFYLDFLQGHR